MLHFAVFSHTLCAFCLQVPPEYLGTSVLVDIVPEDLTKILSCNESIEFGNNNDATLFLKDFNKFLVPFNWSSNNSVIKKTAEYNKYNCGGSNLTIQLWVSFQPRGEDISDDIDSVLEIVNEANSIVAGTVTTIVINYGFLQLDKYKVPFVNHEIRKVHKKLVLLPVPAPKLALQISDTNCLSQSSNDLDKDVLAHLLTMPMPLGKDFPAMNRSTQDIRRDVDRAISPCLLVAQFTNTTGLSVLHLHLSIQVDEIYQYNGSLANFDIGFPLVVMQMGNRVVSSDMADYNKESMTNDFVNWLYRSPGFSKSNFGAVFRSKDVELLSSKHLSSTIFESFSHILIDASNYNPGNISHLKTIAHEIANYTHFKKGHYIKASHDRISMDSPQPETMILVTIDTNDFEVNKRQVDTAISTALEANGITPGTVSTIFLDWLECSRSEFCNAYKMNVSNPDVCLEERWYYNNSIIVEYAKEALKKTRENSTVVIGTALDRYTLDDVLNWLNCKGGLNSARKGYAFLCKSNMHHNDIVNYGGVRAFETAVEDLSVCNIVIRRNKRIPIYFYANVVGCVGDHSNMTLLVEYAKLMENLNGWAERENVLLFTNAGVELPSKCSKHERTGEEVGCQCGWWLKQESHGDYQDKKMVARQLYEKAKADEDKKKAAVPTDSLLLLWVSIPFIVIGASIIILAAFLVPYYRSKYILTNQEVDEFIRGRQATRAEPSTEGDEAAQTRSYNSEKYERSPSTFTIDKTTGCLGSGEYGQVYPGSIRLNGAIIKTAVKMINPSLVRKSHGYYLTLKGLLSEIKILAYVGEHNHIITLLGAYTKNVRKGEIAVFLELCQLGSLHKYLHSITPQRPDDDAGSNIGTSDSEASSLDEEQVERGVISVLDNESCNELFRWAGEIASGMEFLASKKLVHADLATRNVLLNADKVAKISDFGLSRRLYDYTEYVKKSQGALPWRWMAPESLCRSIFNEKTDIWAFGVTLWEMFTLGDQPYPGLSWSPNFCTLLERGMHPPEPKYNVRQVYSIMLRCWDISPALRPTFSQLKSGLDSLL